MSLSWEQTGQLPTILPPPGVRPNFVNPVSLHQYNILTQAVCLSLTTIFVCMRMWTKAVVLKRVGSEDCMLPPGSSEELAETMFFQMQQSLLG